MNECKEYNECMDKHSLHYFMCHLHHFMCHMTQEEYKEMSKGRIVDNFVFNRIQPERSKREDSPQGEMRCSEQSGN
jgi:hypothetical protein